MQEKVRCHFIQKIKLHEKCEEKTVEKVEHQLFTSLTSDKLKTPKSSLRIFPSNIYQEEEERKKMDAINYPKSLHVEKSHYSKH